MDRVAIFVDAGYLYAAGSIALTGHNQRRSDIQMDQPSVIENLRKTAYAQTGGVSLLRIYWYDGARSEGPAREQHSLADADNVKLRLGAIAYGHQKGVDSLIVTDLVELARNRAIADAVLLSGDEDVRIGVQIAQSFGVRVHLIGVEPRRRNQSRALAQEADTTVEWSKSEIEDFMTIATSSHTTVISTDTPIESDVNGNSEDALNNAIEGFMETLTSDELHEVAYLNVNQTVPYQYDSRLLGWIRGAMGRDLSDDERIYIRSRFKNVARALGNPPGEQ